MSTVFCSFAASFSSGVSGFLVKETSSTSLPSFCFIARPTLAAPALNGVTLVLASRSVTSNKSTRALNSLGDNPSSFLTDSTNLVKRDLSLPVDLNFPGVLTDFKKLTNAGLDMP